MFCRCLVQSWMCLLGEFKQGEFMPKILCELNGERVKCKVTENMGYQGGNYVKAIEYHGKEFIVIKDGRIWRPKTIEEKLGKQSVICGQNKFA